MILPSIIPLVLGINPVSSGPLPDLNTLMCAPSRDTRFEAPFRGIKIVLNEDPYDKDLASEDDEQAPLTGVHRPDGPPPQGGQDGSANNQGQIKRTASEAMRRLRHAINALRPRGKG